MYSAAAILLRSIWCYARTFSDSARVQTPALSRVPGLMGEGGDELSPLLGVELR